MIASAATNHLPSMLQPRVIHSIPGRVRLRFDRRESGEALALAERLQAHSAVSSVRWSPSTRSLTIHFQPAQTLLEVLLALPHRGGPATHTAVKPRGLDWGRIATACLLALVPMGPGGCLAVALAAEVVGQVRDRSAAAEPTRWLLID